VLCITQVISWGTLYYAFSVFLHPTGSGQGWKQEQMVGAYSLSLLLSGLCAYPVGQLIHKVGGRTVMSIGSLLAAAAFAVLSVSSSLPVFYAAWAVAGVAMACTLYEAAFSVLAAIYRTDYKRVVTTVTLAGGFASTVFWPLTERLVAWIGWRDTALVYVALHLAICLPLHWVWLPPAKAPAFGRAQAARATTFAELIRLRSFWLLAGSYVLNAVVFSVVSVHLVPLFQSREFTARDAAWIAACAGPMQVFGRLIEFRFGHRWTGSQTGTVALALVLPALIGFAVWPLPAPLVIVAVGLYGVSNGVMTIVRSVSVVEVFGHESYAAVSGALMGPALVSRALGPLLASMILAGQVETNLSS
jgi:MFS family permease